MNKNKLFMSIILMMLVLPLFASAQADDGLLGGLDKSLFEAIGDIINYPMHIPAAQIYSDKTTQELTMPVWLLFAGFTIIYCIIWLASSFVPLFKGPENNKIRIFFSIAITLITMFVTPVMLWIVKLTSLATTVTYLLLLVLVGYTIWTIFRSGWSSNRMENAQSSKVLSDAAQMNAETARQQAQTENYLHKTAQAANSGLHQQTTAIRNLRRDLGRVLGDLTQIKNRAIYPPANATYRRILNDMARISTDAGQIAKFKSETDRILGGMSAGDYKRVANPTINKVEGGLAHVKQGVDSETNDLGHSISAIAQTLKAEGINAANINHLMSWTEAAINITNQMERDVVTEEQMIEKI